MSDSKFPKAWLDATARQARDDSERHWVEFAAAVCQNVPEPVQRYVEPSVLAGRPKTFHGEVTKAVLQLKIPSCQPIALGFDQDEKTKAWKLSGVVVAAQTEPWAFKVQTVEMGLFLAQEIWTEAQASACTDENSVEFADSPKTSTARVN